MKKKYRTKVKILIAIAIILVVGLIVWFTADEILWSGHTERDMWPQPPRLHQTK